MLGRSDVQADAHTHVDMLEFGDDRREQICACEGRCCDHYRARAAFAKLGGA
jgi:hypothetical protein